MKTVAPEPSEDFEKSSDGSGVNHKTRHERSKIESKR